MEDKKKSHGQLSHCDGNEGKGGGYNGKPY